jgi:hypothetical protein
MSMLRWLGVRVLVDSLGGGMGVGESEAFFLCNVGAKLGLGQMMTDCIFPYFATRRRNV